MEQVSNLAEIILSDFAVFGIFGVILMILLPWDQISAKSEWLRRINRSVVVIVIIVICFVGLGLWLWFSEPSHVQVGIEDHVPIKKEQNAFRLNENGEYVFEYVYENMRHLSTEKVGYVLVEENDDRAGTVSGTILADGKVDPISGGVVWVDKSNPSFRPEKVYLSSREIAIYKDLDFLPRSNEEK